MASNRQQSSEDNHMYVNDLEEVRVILSDGTTGPVCIPKSICSQLIAENDNVQQTNTSTSTTANTKSNVNLTETVRWTHEAVTCFINVVGAHQDKFNDHSYKQRQVWEIVGKEMMENGFNIHPNDCDSKFRSLKHRHKVISDHNRGKGGRGRRYWQYFDPMEKVLNGLANSAKIMASSTVTNSATSPNDQSEDTVVYKPLTQTLRPSTSAARPQMWSSPSGLLQSDSTTSGASYLETLASEQSDTHPSKRRRKASKAPEWFSVFLDQYNEKMELVLDNQRRLLEVANEKNKILAKIANSLENQ